ncbi:sodium:proton antiporter [Roseiconus nitratireducens]|uniref:Sodium:proton antiporter n=1 Tax=Roseiconus nitratireducens TaxID=2605748 RepID=A0A5M6DFX0_9BACT|nr:sodium:proton antiporter [Roseiconus nitratireducens]KAA5545296.1 sodium:proton antiporter [Roseiconus nitratireducens]
MELPIYLALVPAMAVAAQWLAWRTRLPSILLLLIIGVALGQFIRPDDLLAAITGGDATVAGPAILFPIVSLAVAVIMLEGGLSLKLDELRESGGAALRLCTIGAVATFLGVSIAAHFVLEFNWRLSCLLGAILVVTGPTVIGPLLRQIQPRRRVSNTLKWEGIVIDPIGAVLAVLVFEQLMLHASDATLIGGALLLGKTALAGTMTGVVGGLLLSLALRRFWIPDSLHGVASLAIALLLFAVSNHIAPESGLITVTVMGLWLTNQIDLEIEHIIEFHENLRTLLIGCLFVVLGSRVDLGLLGEVGWSGVVFLAVIVLIIRPVSVFISLIGSSLDLREQVFVAGLAPRGIVAAAVSSVFALEIEQLGDRLVIPDAEQLTLVTFLVIVGTVAIYGVVASPLANWLQLATSKSNGVLILGADPWVRDFAVELKELDIPTLLIDTNYRKVSEARMAGLDAECLNILNEPARHDLPLNGIGKMMALLQNDEVNTLAIHECSGLFDRSELYQLSFNLENSHNRRGMTKNLKARELFGQTLTFSQLRDLHARGAHFKRTKLGEEFTFQDYQRRYPDGAFVLCVVDEDRNVIPMTVDNPFTPAAGQTIIALVAAPDG